MREIKFRVWDGDTTYGYKENGYQMRQVKYHPNANKRGYLAEHRLIIENQLGRYLIPRKEIIHHINGVRDDNRIENLKISNPKDHAIGHIGERNENGRFVCVSPEFQRKKFRLYDADRNTTQIYTLSELIGKTYRRGKFEYRGESTGLNDKNGEGIYEGDILRQRVAERDTQTHYGDNIPLGEYTEPLEPIINENIHVVFYANGMFMGSDTTPEDHNGEGAEYPLVWDMIDYDVDSMKEDFSGGWSGYGVRSKFDWEGEEGDLGYLLERYNLKDEDELIKYLGVEVIGNIHENPELI